MKNTLIPIFVILLLFPITTYSQGYFGANAGQAEVDSLDSIFDESTSYSLFGGYKFNEYFALEASYVDFGKSKFDLDSSVYVEADGFDVGILGILPITDRFELFVRLGFMSWDVKGDGYAGEFSEDGSDPDFGVGAAYNFTDNFSVFGGYQQYKFESDGNEEVHNYYLGARIYFGSKGRRSSPIYTNSYSVPATIHHQSFSQNNVELRAVSESEKRSCGFVKTITRGAGGPNDPSTHLERAMENALKDAASAGANSYYIVDTGITESGASIILEALNCH